MSLNYVALMKMREAEEDDAEACLDAAGSSYGGDEFKSESRAGLISPQLADARCVRCSEGDDFALLISGMDDALIAYADRVLGDDPVWSRLKAVRQAMSESL